MPTWYGFDAELTAERAHGGRGEVLAARVVDRDRGPLAFMDLVVVPVGVSIGRHTHGSDEEVYVVVSGRAEIQVDGVRRLVGSGDVVVNRPGGTHELANHGPDDVRLVVLDVRHAPATDR